jgi:2-keto-4-pentenoate hydratase/2-oxohepta-3-ene-1,7-dioic acid hydratase in catechol pathway
LDVPDVPSLFLKAPEAISDPNSKILVHPTCQDNQVDWEVELAIVIGRKCRDVSEEDAMDYVLGVTVANDITARRHQKTSSQWCYGKGISDGLHWASWESLLT